MLHREHGSGAAESGLHLVGDQQNTLTVADCPQTTRELGRSRQETALTLHRLDDNGRHGIGRRLVPHQALDPGNIVGGSTFVAIWIRESGMEDAGRERSEALFIWAIR